MENNNIGFVKGTNINISNGFLIGSLCRKKHHMKQGFLGSTSLCHKLVRCLLQSNGSKVHVLMRVKMFNDFLAIMEDFVYKFVFSVGKNDTIRPT